MANRAKINVKVVSKNLFSNTVQLDDLDKNLVVPKSGWGNEAILKGFPKRLFPIHTDGVWMVYDGRSHRRAPTQTRG